MCEIPAPLLPNVPRTIERFEGTWPCFHDSSIERFDLDTDMGCLILAFHVFRYGPPGPDGVYAHELESLVVIRFDGVRSTVLNGANDWSSLDEVKVTGEAGNIRVELVAHHGVDGSFVCDTFGELVVEPYDRLRVRMSYLDSNEEP